MDKYILHFDGACWPNPNGRASYGFILEKNGILLKEGAGLTGDGQGMSNNVAEHDALCQGLNYFLSIYDFKPCKLQVYGDSEIIIKQMRGEYKGKKGMLYYPYYLKSKEIDRRLNTINVFPTYNHVYREQNTRCDNLSKINQKKS